MKRHFRSCVIALAAFPLAGTLPATQWGCIFEQGAEQWLCNAHIGPDCSWCEEQNSYIYGRAGDTMCYGTYDTGYQSSMRCREIC